MRLKKRLTQAAIIDIVFRAVSSLDCTHLLSISSPLIKNNTINSNAFKGFGQPKPAPKSRIAFDSDDLTDQRIAEIMSGIYGRDLTADEGNIYRPFLVAVLSTQANGLT